MNENKPPKPSFLSKFTFFKRLKSIKHFEIVLALTLGAIIIAVYFSSFSPTSSGTTPNKSGTQIEYTNASQYAQELEQKLSNLISKIDGVGKAEVMVVLSSSSELIVAKKTTETIEKETGSNGIITENISKEESPIIITQNGANEPLILLEIMPKIAGVVVVAEGANDVSIKLNILKAVQALLSVPNGNIEIING